LLPAFQGLILFADSCSRDEKLKRCGLSIKDPSNRSDCYGNGGDGLFQLQGSSSIHEQESSLTNALFSGIGHNFRLLLRRI